MAGDSENTQDERALQLAEVNYALCTLVEAMDVFRLLEDGDDHFSAETLGKFGRLAIGEAGERLEKALFALGALKECATPELGGWFVDEFRGKPGIARLSESVVTDS